MKRSSLDILDEKNILIKRNLDILNLAKREDRELTEEEEKEFEETEEKIKALNEEAEELEKELEETPETDENKNNDTEMEKKSFSLVKELRNAMRSGNSIKFEKRAGEPNYSVTSNGEDVVETDIVDILEPLRANLVLTAAGAQYMSGLVGDVQIPIMSAANCGWKGEVATAEDGSGSFTNVTLQPKRLTAFYPISLQFLAQDSVDAEAKIRQDIINCIADKIEATVLGYAAGDTTKPAGIFYDQTLTEITNYADLCDFEANVEEANVRGKMNYIVTPKAKAALKGMIKGTNNTGMVWDNDEVDGTPAHVTTNLVCESANKNGILFGNFDNLIIGTWDTLQMDVVRDTASLKNGCVTIVINFFCDAVVARPEAFAYGEYVAPEGD